MQGLRPRGGVPVVLRVYDNVGYIYLQFVHDGTLTPAEEEKICRLLSPEYDFSREPSGNLGIANVNQRLRILYGEPCGLTIEKDDEQHVIARLTIAAR